MDFTYPVADGYTTAVIPLKYKSKMWFFIDPFSFRVWIGFIVCIPIYIIAMGLADYLYAGYAELGDLSGFIIRTAMSEQKSQLLNCSQGYKKLLIIIWASCMLVLVQSYAGNLTAMLARPKLQEPIKTFEQLLNQNEIQWIIADETREYHMATSNPGSVPRRLYEGSNLITNKPNLKCFTTELLKDGLYGSICNSGSIMALMNYDYSTTGKCNYYTTEERFLTSGASIAFQVEIIY